MSFNLRSKMQNLSISTCNLSKRKLRESPECSESGESSESLPIKSNIKKKKKNNFSTCKSILHVKSELTLPSTSRMLDDNIKDSTAEETSINNEQSAASSPEVTQIMLAQEFVNMRIVLEQVLTVLNSNSNDIRNFIQTFSAGKSSKNAIETKKKVIFRGKNLAAIPKNKKSQFTNGVLRVLFTKEELASGLIIEEDDKSTSKRIALDLERVKLLKDAINIKFKVKPVNQPKFWMKMKKVANAHCRDQTKKQKIKRFR